MTLYRLLEAFGIKGLFHHHMIENHPNKDIMISKLLAELGGKGIRIPLCRVVYIDDRTIHIEAIYRNVGRLVFLQAWKDFKSYEEAVEKIEESIEKCMV